MAIGAVIGAAAAAAAPYLMNSAGSAFNNALSYKYSRKLAKFEAELNYKYARKNAENSPLWQRKGLEDAGYNPMLAIQNGIGASNSSWASADQFQNQSPPVNALELQQQDNNNKLAEAQVRNYNADSQLKTQQSITETFTQLQKQVHTDLERIQTELSRKDLSYYDRKYLIWEKAKNQEIERMAIQNKVDIMNAWSNQVSANAYDINSRSIANQRDFETEWAKKHPYLYSTSRAGAGAGALVGTGVGSALGVYNAVNGRVPKTGKVGF